MCVKPATPHPQLLLLLLTLALCLPSLMVPLEASFYEFNSY
jgi:hypothetical protein